MVYFTSGRGLGKTLPACLPNPTDEKEVSDKKEVSGKVPLRWGEEIRDGRGRT